MSPRDLDELRELALTAFTREMFSPLGVVHAVVLSKDVLANIRVAPDRERLAAWLANLPCPVIGVGEDPGEGAMHSICDVVASSDFDVSAILANIDRAPIAAMILVQVLRATAALPLAEGLRFESLAYATLQAGPEYAAWLAGRQPIVASARLYHDPPVLVEREEDRLRLSLNRPTTLNALSTELRDALCETLQLVLTDTSIAKVSISGEGRCFSIGGDLNEFGSTPDPATGHAVRSVRMPALFLSQCADRVDFNLHGACIGAGVELPAFGRHISAKRNSFFQLPEIRFGLIPGAGGCISIPRRIGRQRTAYLALSARRITAAKALEWGLIDAITD